MAERQATPREAFSRLPACCQRLLSLLIDESPMPDTKPASLSGQPSMTTQEATSPASGTEYSHAGRPVRAPEAGTGSVLPKKAAFTAVPSHITNTIRSIRTDSDTGQSEAGGVHIVLICAQPGRESIIG